MTVLTTHINTPPRETPLRTVSLSPEYIDKYIDAQTRHHEQNGGKHNVPADGRVPETSTSLCVSTFAARGLGSCVQVDAQEHEEGDF